MNLSTANMFGSVVVVGMVVVLIDFEMEVVELFALFGAEIADPHAPRNGSGKQRWLEAGVPRCTATLPSLSVWPLRPGHRLTKSELQSQIRSKTTRISTKRRTLLFLHAFTDSRKRG